MGEIFLSGSKKAVFDSKYGYIDRMDNMPNSRILGP